MVSDQGTFHTTGDEPIRGKMSWVCVMLHNEDLSNFSAHSKLLRIESDS
jgi:hypothetical protein